jgi:hypothetical protein
MRINNFKLPLMLPHAKIAHNNRGISMTLERFQQLISESPQTIQFQDVMQIIDEYYQYTPTKFTNGKNDDTIINEAGQNEGSCKIFALAKLLQLSEQATLNCFGSYYRDDVLQHPQGNDHANIRTFMKYGWQGIQFSGTALQAKNQAHD